VAFGLEALLLAAAFLVVVFFADEVCFALAMGSQSFVGKGNRLALYLVNINVEVRKNTAPWKDDGVK